MLVNAVQLGLLRDLEKKCFPRQCHKRVSIENSQLKTRSNIKLLWIMFQPFQSLPLKCGPTKRYAAFILLSPCSISRPAYLQKHSFLYDSLTVIYVYLRLAHHSVMSSWFRGLIVYLFFYCRPTRGLQSQNCSCSTWASLTIINPDDYPVALAAKRQLGNCQATV